MQRPQRKLTPDRAQGSRQLAAAPTFSEIKCSHTLVLDRLRQIADGPCRADLRSTVRWRDATLTVRPFVARCVGARLDIIVEPADGGTLALAVPRPSSTVSAAGALALILAFGVAVGPLRDTAPVTWPFLTTLSGLTALWLLGRWVVRRDTPILLAAWLELIEETTMSARAAGPQVRPPSFGAGVFAELIERGWMHRVLRIRTSRAVRTLQYVGFGAGWDGVDIDGELVTRDKSTWLRAQRLMFSVDGQAGLLVVRKWPWFTVRDLELTLDAMQVYRD